MSETVNDYTAILAYLGNQNLRFNAFTELGTSIVVTYSFNETDELPPGSDGYYGVDSFQTFTPYQREMMRQVIEEAGSIAGIIFVEVEGGDAMINMYSGVDGDGGGVSASGYANYGMGLETNTYSSDLVMIYQDFTPGGFTYGVLLHELGHSLGLSHTHSGDHVLDEEHDHAENSVMTYNFSWDHPEEFGVLDVEALSHLYGDKAAIAGFTSKVNDAGMIVITASNRDDSLIAADIGSKIIGKDGRDTLWGREGEDILLGGARNDHLQGGLGSDEIHGQKGNDTIIGDLDSEYYGAADLLTGGRGKDGITGGAGDDVANGNQGNDRIDGGRGADRIAGGKGNDIITGGRDDDRLSGGIGQDQFIFSNADNGDRDVITDFEHGIDIIDLSAMTYLSEGGLAISQSGEDTILYSSGYSFTLVLEGIDSAAFQTSDIVFA